MKKCPNCGRAALRTGDWACPWCGYPLLSPSYKKTDSTFRELQDERLEQAAATREMSYESEATLLEETEPEEAPEAVMAVEAEEETRSSVTEEETELELEAAEEFEEEEEIIEPETPPEPEPVAEEEAEPEPAPKPKPRARKAAAKKAAPAARKTRKTKAGPKPELEPAAMETAAEAEADETPLDEAEAMPEPAPAAPGRPASGQGRVDFATTVEDMLEDYAEDGNAADAKYQGKVVRVSGLVERIEIKHNLGIYYVTLGSESGNSLQGVRCVFDPASVMELSKLETGQQLTVQGIFSGSIIDISLRDCVIVE